MRRKAVCWTLALGLLFAAGPAFALRQGPPPEPPKEPVKKPAKEPAKESLRPQLSLQLPPPPPIEEPVTQEIVPPEKVFVPGATSIAVVLDTPMSTRITKKGHEVVFLTSQSVRLEGGIELPPDTRILATVIEAKRPGIFGRPGAMKVRIERIELEGESTRVVGRLEGVDANAGKITCDANRTANLYNLATWGLSGTLIGAQAGGGKGALIGAGAGAAAALVLAMSRRGPDLYLEPGTPFAVVIDEALELPGATVHAAQRKWAKENGFAHGEDVVDPERPVLKKRPPS